jgi:hypothetical protein
MPPKQCTEIESSNLGRTRTSCVDALGWAEVTYSGLIISQLILILMQLGRLNSFELTVVKLIVMIIIILSTI